GNRGKRSIVVDLGHPAGRDRLDRLVERADVVLESPGGAGRRARLVDVDAALRGNPRLVVTSISAFGLDGPYADLPGPDLIVAALSGLVWLTGDEDRAPLRVSVPQSFRQASAEAAVHTLVALHHAARTGQGQHVDVAALPTMVRTIMNASEYEALEGVGITRMGSRASTVPNRPRVLFSCADGEVVFMTALGPMGGPAIQHLISEADDAGIEVPKALRDVDLLDPRAWHAAEADGRIGGMAAALEAVISGVFALHTKEELYDAALEQGWLLAPVNTVADLHADRQLAARDFWCKAETPDGATVAFPGPWARLAATPMREAAPAPPLGQDAQPGWEHAASPPGPGGEAAGQDPFAGLKVWDMSWVGVGPLTSRYLADYGATVVRLDHVVRADVLRVSPPFAGGVPGINRSQFYADFNSSKLGIGLDIARPEGQEVAQRLAAWADVVLESFTPRTLRGLGLHYEDLRTVNPSLVMLSTCMQGQTGPCRDYRGFGQLMGALTGFYEVTGWPDRGPTMVWGAYTDFVAQRFCATALIAAIDHRQRTGEGQHIDVSQLEASLQVLGPELLDYAANDRVVTRQGNRDPSAAPHGIYPCRPIGPGPGGERWIAIVVEDDEQWEALVAALGRPAWATAGTLGTVRGRKANEDEIEGRLAEWTAELEIDECLALLRPAV
ncbi:MAG TPA: CoA transferase, partial [Acidimicrobiales bacterium]